MTARYLFNHYWLFRREDAPEGDDFLPVTLPHSHAIVPHHYFDQAEFAYVSSYRKHFRIPEALDGRRAYLDFDGVMLVTEVMLNGEKLGEHKGGYTPFSFDLTDHLLEDRENDLIVRVDATERDDVPPFGFVVGFLTFGGIYRDVWLRLAHACHIENVYVRPDISSGISFSADIQLINQLNSAVSGQLDCRITTPEGEESARWAVAFSLEAGERAILTTQITGLSNIKYWTLDDPQLYCFVVEVVNDDGKRLDERSERFGFRDAQFRTDGFYLNGERIKLIGLNRHQTFPYFGAAAPSRLQRRDADILRYELGSNIVRTSHYPQSPHFLDRCDEIGLLVFEEIPGWQHIGDEAWQKISLQELREMIVRDRNHPSIVAWGVRINESRDDTRFYTATNALARELDPTRPTSGVRGFDNPESEYLEDVFAFNDFSNGVMEPRQTPYLITEFAGHMLPTKAWDSDERQLAHALLHANIQNAQMGMQNVSGALGWCAFDYNTHKDFGSGDRIDYHGVMSIFRLPKYAAYFYESQQSPARRPVLKAATLWSMGDRDGSGNDPLYVFSNCERITVTIGDEFYGTFTPAYDEFPHLTYPPFKVTGLGLVMLWGSAVRDLHLYGYVGDQLVAEQHFAADGLPTQLQLAADDTMLRADGMDMTRVVCRVTDRYGNRLPYFNQPVFFELRGPAEFIGENPFALPGGQAAIYIRVTQEAGIVTLKATTERLPSVEVHITVVEVGQEAPMMI